MEAKRQAGEVAAALVESGMRLGLGTGSTVEYFLRRLGERIRSEGLQVAGVPTSRRSEDLARELGIPLLDWTGEPLDLAVDGADQVAKDGTLIKGGGGALLREKIVAFAARRRVIIVDEGKVQPPFGAFPLPVEIATFGWEATLRHLRSLCPGARERRGADGSLFLTDNGHPVVDLPFGTIPDPEGTARVLCGIPGVLEHGLFLAMDPQVLVGDGQRVLVWRQGNRE